MLHIITVKSPICKVLQHVCIFRVIMKLFAVDLTFCVFIFYETLYLFYTSLKILVERFMNIISSIYFY